MVDKDVTQYSSYGIGTVSVGLTEAFCGRNNFVKLFLLTLKPWTTLVYLRSIYWSCWFYSSNTQGCCV